MSLVDAAHAIGQIKTDVKNGDCDFWVAVGSPSFDAAVFADPMI